MTSSEMQEVLLEGSAIRLGFQIGQCFEKVLVDRAVRRAKQRCTGEVLVTSEDVLASIDDSLLDEIRRFAGVSVDAECEGQRRLSA
jgi:hypothetical protein